MNCKTIFNVGSLARGSALSGHRSRIVIRSVKKAAIIGLALCALAAGQGKPKIAVYVTGAEEPSANKAFATMVLGELVGDGKYQALERSDEFQRLSTTGLGQGGTLAYEQIRTLGVQFGADFLCIAEITPALGSNVISARIVDVRSSENVAVGNTNNPLKTLSDLSEASQRLVGTMSGKAAVQQAQKSSPAQPSQHQTSHPQQDDPQQGRAQQAPSQQTSPQQGHQPAYADFTAGERWGTWALNCLVPGVGSYTIMKDNRGGSELLSTAILGYAGIIWGWDKGNTYTYRYNTVTKRQEQIATPYVKPNWFYFVGSISLLYCGIYNIVRSAGYHKPNFTAYSLENSGLDLAVLPDGDGNVRGYMGYRWEF